MIRMIGCTAITVASATLALAQGQPEPNVPVNNYAGYAFADCGPGNTPAVRIVLPAGKQPIPAAVPPSPPRPAVELLIQSGLDAALGQKLTVVQEAGQQALSVVALSCPVVGGCSRARTGTLSLQRRADDGALTGEFRIRWPDEPARATDVIGKFVASWREAAKKCG